MQEASVGKELHIDDIMNRIQDLATRIIERLEPVNIIVVGQTGVGKSTLINSIFDKDVAEASSGRPVTQKSTWYKSRKKKMNILDTKGIEAKNYNETRQQLLDEVKKSRNSASLSEQIHLAWVCISTASDRLQDSDLEVMKILSEHHIPTIVVMTKYAGEDDFVEKVRSFLVENSINIADLICVNSVPSKFVPKMGIKELVQKSFEIIPEAVQAAFAAAQTVNFDIKRSAAEKYVLAATATAATIAGSPLPFADALSLIPVQAGMIYAISDCFGIKTTKETIVPILGGIAGSLGMAIVGRALVSNILKLIPAVGTVAGGIISATVAGTLTKALGGLYIKFVEDYYKKNGELPNADELKQFGEYYENNK